MEESRLSLLTKRLSPRGLLLCSILFCASFAQAGYVGDTYGVSPFRNWRTIETDHFRVNFPLEQERFAQIAADYLEEAWTPLTEQLYWKPFNMINVVVLDNSDAANGSASPFARFGITLYPTPPETAFSTSFTDDWIRMLVWHELTHFINMDTTRSFYSVLRVLAGDTTLPNVLWPNWMLEGWAVWNETRYSRLGRGRSPYWEGVLRAGIAEGRLGTRDWVTLDRINGSYPWFPGGETPYLFGYQLMNQVARDPRLKQTDGKETRTTDGDHSFRDGEDALGLMSYRSAGRIPYFINGNLENITSRSWYDYWAEFLNQTKERMQGQLNKIRSQPLTPYERLTENGFNSLGPAASPDGKWLAYTARTSEERYGLRLVELATGQSRRLDDKLFGTSLSFSADSKWLFYSELNQRYIYDSYSDLFARPIPTGRPVRLTRGLRAKDPDVSRDGLWLTYTVAENAGNSLAISPVEWRGETPHVGPPRIVYRPGEFGRVGNPRFSPNGKRVVFSVLERGTPGESLMELDVEKETTRVLLADDHRNVFPVFAPDAQLYFVSNRSGVENLYRWRREGAAEQVTNVTTGLWTPTFGPQNVYASLLSTEGWDISKIDLLPQAVDTRSVQVAADAAPRTDEKAKDQATHLTRAHAGYNPLKSLLPRVWMPEGAVAYSDAWGLSAYLGAMVLGFDTLDLHGYEFRLGYLTLSQNFVGSAHYEYRGLGPTLALDYAESITAETPFEHIRQREGAMTASLPVKFTWSQLTPSLALSAQRQYLHSNIGTLLELSRWVPRLDVGLGWTDLVSAELAIHPIGGRRMFLASRIYSDDGAFSVKGLFKYEENLRIWRFLVASPSLAASATFPFQTSGFVGDNVQISGTGTSSVLDQGPMATTLTRVWPRGYSAALSTPWILYPALDLRFPLLRIFEGVGTNPLFAENFWLQTWVESALTQGAYGGPLLSLPSVGAGLRLDATVFLRLPLVLGLDAAYAFNLSQGGGFTVSFGVSGLALPF